MNDVFDIYTIIFLALAVFIFLRLRSVLGQRTGRERPPYDPFAAREPVRPARKMSSRCPIANRKPPRRRRQRPSSRPIAGRALPSPVRPSPPVSTPSPPTAPDFDAKHFLTGARAAYEMIVNAYAEGDRRTLKNLLSREVFDGFESAINEREKRGDTVESRFVSIDNAEIAAAEVRGRNIQMTVRFQSKLVSVTRDKDGNVIDGNRREGHRRHRRLDLRARRLLARSELEAGRHRSRAVNEWRGGAHVFSFLVR